MSDARHSSSGCLDAETLAAFLDNRLAPDARAAVEAHLAECEDCYEVWMDAGSANQSIASPPASPAPVRSYSHWLTGVGLLAASLVAAVWVWPLLRPDPAARALDDLVAAVGTSRISEARLSVDFAHGPQPSPTRGEADDLPPVLSRTAWTAATSADDDATPFAARVAAAGFLTLKRHDDAIRTLEDAAALAPNDGLLALDLGAALLERHRVVGDRQADAAQALEATEHAVRLLPADASARFNRALALEANGRFEEAVEAWDAYLGIDSTSPWAEEARDNRKRLVALIGGPPLASLEGLSPADLVRLASDEPWRLLDFIDRVALPAWVSAGLSGGWYPLTEAAAAAAALKETKRDRYAHDLLTALSTQPVGVHRAAATALRHLQQSREAFNVSKYEEADRLARHATAQLSALGLPTADADMFAAFALYFKDDRESAVAEAARIRQQAESDGYLRVAARADYMTGQFFVGQVDLERGLHLLEQAAALYDRAGDRAQVSATESQLMFVARSAGQDDEPWERAAASAGLLNATAPPRLRYMVLSNLQYHLVESGHFHTALPLTDGLETLVNAWNDPLYSSDVALLKIGLHKRLGDTAAVHDATATARRHAARIAEPLTRGHYDHAIDFAVARALHTVEPLEALPTLNRILDRLVSLNRPLLIAEARLLRGRAHAALGDSASAVADWQEGLRVVEHEREVLTAPELAVPRADRQWDLYAALITHHRDDEVTSLATAERARARALLSATPADVAEPSVDDLHSWLPEDMTVLSYAVLDDSLARWTITRSTGVQLTVTPLPPGGLEPLITRFIKTLQTDGPAAATNALATLVLPTEWSGPGARLVVIPDGPLHRVPFGALKLRDGRVLLEATELSLAPSVAWLRAAATVTTVPAERRALLVGFGGAQPERRLSPLPRVADEIQELRRLYGTSSTHLVGSSATPDAVMANIGSHNIVHIAGHAVSDNLRPWESRIFLAPTAERDALTVADIDGLRLHSGSLVLLSACSTAAGRTFRGEGVINLARPFLFAGASAVLASLWPVRDDDASRTMVAVHRELRNGASLAAALTTVQRAELQARPDRWLPWMVLGS